MPPHDPTLWLESDSDLSSEPSGLPNAELGDVDAVVASAVVGRLFQRLRLLNLLKVDGVEQVGGGTHGRNHARGMGGTRPGHDPIIHPKHDLAQLKAFVRRVL